MRNNIFIIYKITNLTLVSFMFIVTFELQCKPENKFEINQSLKAITKKVKKLDGCKKTKIYTDVDDENIFFLVEEWDNQRLLDDHMKTSLFSALLGIEGLLVKEPRIKFMDES